MRVLALNCGSSSVKGALVDVAGARRLLDVRVAGVGSPRVSIQVDDVTHDSADEIGFAAAVERVFAELRHAAPSVGRPDAVAHRIVHGGHGFVGPEIVTDDVLARLERLDPLAPLHNPAALAAVRLARSALPDVAHVAVFDTAFHATLPAHAREYALPFELRDALGIRRYGFHGISHAHVARTVAEHMRAQPRTLRIVSCHLGNGASVAAIEDGRSVETSMGMTPLEGLVMGTRAGDLDPGVLVYLLRSGRSVDELDELLNTRSGLLGMTGTNDMRAVEERADGGQEDCRLAIAVYAHRVRKYIGAYAAVLGGVDAVAFTGGVGENSPTIRRRCTERLEYLGAVLDRDRNLAVRLTADRPLADVSAHGSRVRLLVVRADEELAMAREAAARLTAS